MFLYAANGGMDAFGESLFVLVAKLSLAVYKGPRIQTAYGQLKKRRLRSKRRG
jgi:hypothetical protein